MQLQKYKHVTFILMLTVCRFVRTSGMARQKSRKFKVSVHKKIVSEDLLKTSLKFNQGQKQRNKEKSRKVKILCQLKK